MMFSVEDKALIKNLHLLKGYGCRKLLAEFPEKNWTKSGLDTLLRKLRDTGSTGWAVDDQELHALKTTSRRWRNWYSARKQHHRVTVQRDKFKGDRCASVVGLTHISQGSDVELYEKAVSLGAD